MLGPKGGTEMSLSSLAVASAEHYAVRFSKAWQTA
jgi:hypothetical protein